MGQIATFMESLHLSYKEVFEEIPYRNLIVMSKDKLHVVYGKLIKKRSGKDFAAARKERMNA